ncbi:hypothetical protein ET33_33465 [Paenibacillus tyrfis]|uniref:Uncharacterized protein n=1 Tax=Paenibacillus tyrfis TaxID=1501230 RepID=A0A081P7R8_9BACL|nr:hypothetical protein ET33_33465 [Paenibacillus tyrfis]
MTCFRGRLFPERVFFFWNKKVSFYKDREAYGGGVSTGEAIAAAFVFGKCPLLSGFQSKFPEDKSGRKWIPHPIVTSIIPFDHFLNKLRTLMTS